MCPSVRIPKTLPPRRGQAPPSPESPPLIGPDEVARLPDLLALPVKIGRQVATQRQNGHHHIVAAPLPPCAPAAPGAADRGPTPDRSRAGGKDQRRIAKARGPILGEGPGLQIAHLAGVHLGQIAGKVHFGQITGKDAAEGFDPFGGGQDKEGQGGSLSGKGQRGGRGSWRCGPASGSPG